MIRYIKAFERIIEIMSCGCARIPVLNEERLIPYSEHDFCDIRNASNLNEKLHSYLYNTKYLNGCKYCDGQHVYSQEVESGE